MNPHGKTVPQFEKGVNAITLVLSPLSLNKPHPHKEKANLSDMPKCTCLLPCDWLISYLNKAASRCVYLHFLVCPHQKKNVWRRLSKSFSFFI